MRAYILAVLAAAGSAHGQAAPPGAQALASGVSVERALAPSGSHDYTVHLDRGTSALVTVQQIGVDVVVEVRSPDGRLLQAVDSPVGRSGEERVEIFADRGGDYGLRVRPYDSGEPAGSYGVNVAELRDARETASLLAERKRARDAAADWLRGRAAPLTIGVERDLPPLDALARDARVIGLGEATHGSRELSDLRFAVTRYLAQRHGVRLVAIEHSASRLAILNSWALGGPVDDAEVQHTLDSGWIGRRTLGELVRWLREWNAAHPGDPIRLVGVDAQDNAAARARLREFLSGVYDEEALKILDAALDELEVADTQASVFGNSQVSPATLRTLIGIVARLDADAPLLKLRVGAGELESARDAARQLMQFADFNAGEPGSRSRDWYMAANLVRALDAVPTGTRAVFWSHNAHVAVPAGGSAGRTSGAFLREALGCGYRALATSFGEGGVIAQLPDDPEDRLVASVLPPAPDETIDAVMGLVYRGGAVAVWACDPRADDAPAWLKSPQSLHWVGALYDPQSLASDAFRPFTLVQQFDGIIYLPKVTADEIYGDRPVIPARSR